MTDRKLYITGAGEANFGARGIHVPKKSSSAGKTLLMLGGSLLQLPALRIAKDEGWRIILADGNKRVVGRAFCDIFEHIDLKDKEGMLSMARRYHQEGQLDGVFTAATDFSATVAYVTEALKLPGHSYEAALNASSKLLMRRLFQKHGIPSPRFIEVEPSRTFNEDLLSDFAFPLVVKPIDNMGARGVQRVDTILDVQAALARARQYSRAGVVLIEERINGVEYSIDSLIFEDNFLVCGIASRHIYFPPNFVEMGHSFPCDLSEKDQHEMIKVFKKAVRVLGLHHGAAKGDVFLTDHGPVIGEIAARLSGGYMSGWTFPYASEYEVTRAALHLCMGLPVAKEVPIIKHSCIERAYISVDGEIQSTQCNIQGKNLEGVTDVFWRYKPGDSVKFPENNVEKAANIVVCAKHLEPAQKQACNALKSIRIRLKPNHPATQRFLVEWSNHHNAFPMQSAQNRTRFLRQAQSLIRGNEKSGTPPQIFDIRRFVQDTLLPPNHEFVIDEKETDWHGIRYSEAVQELLKEFEPNFARQFTNADAPIVSFFLLLGFMRGSIQLAYWVLQTLANREMRSEKQLRQWLMQFIQS